MQVLPKTGPNTLNPAQPEGLKQNQKDMSRKERAMKALLSSNSPPPVGNASAMTPIEHVSMQHIVNTNESSTEGEHPNTNETSVVETSAPVVKEETKPTEERKSSPEDRSRSQYYADLARRERALRAKVEAQERAIREKESAIKAQEDALKARELEYQSKYISKDRLNEDPLSVLNDSGLSYEKLTELMLNPQSNTHSLELKRYQEKMEAEIKSLKEEQQKSIKAQEEATKTQYQQALNQIHFDVKAEVDSNPAFEIIKATQSTKDVVDLIERVYKREGRLLSVDEACREVEDYLMEEADKISKINKIKQKFQQAATAVAPVAKSNKVEQQPQQLKTLTNSVTSSKKLSARERAVLRFQGKLN